MEARDTEPPEGRTHGRVAGRDDGGVWPFGARAAIGAVPLVAIVLLAAFAVARALADWPEPRSDNLVLAGVLVLSLVPLFLVLFDTVASRGGAIEYRGIRIDFARVLATKTQVAIPANIGAPGIPVPDSESVKILDALRDAVHNEIVVVDLEDGSAWWETRLLVLCAGAARLGRPVAIVFLATDHNVPQHFQGWAPPEALMRALLRADGRYRDAYHAAQFAAKQWALVKPPALGGPDPPSAPKDATGVANVTVVAFINGQPNELAPEQFLAAALGNTAESQPRAISVVRLRELFAPVLHTDAVDPSWSNDRRVDAVLASDTDYLAVADRGRYLGLLSRAAAHDMILTALVSHARGQAAPGT